MTELPVMNIGVVNSIKKLMDNIKNDIDPGNSMDDIADMVHDNKLIGKNTYRPLLQSVCDLLREKGYPATADFFTKHWRL
jgi:hypothetical protein